MDQAHGSHGGVLLLPTSGGILQLVYCTGATPMGPHHEKITPLIYPTLTFLALTTRLWNDVEFSWTGEQNYI